jgi:hypothetical protein
MIAGKFGKRLMNDSGNLNTKVIPKDRIVEGRGAKNGSGRAATESGKRLWSRQIRRNLAPETGSRRKLTYIETLQAEENESLVKLLMSTSGPWSRALGPGGDDPEADEHLAEATTPSIKQVQDVKYAFEDPVWLVCWRKCPAKTVEMSQAALAEDWQKPRAQENGIAKTSKTGSSRSARRVADHWTIRASQKVDQAGR